MVPTCPTLGAGPRGTAAGLCHQHGHCGAKEGTLRPGRRGAGPQQLQSGSVGCGLPPPLWGDRTVLASTVAAVSMGAVAAGSGHLLPPAHYQEARPCGPAATHRLIAPLTAEQLYAVAAVLPADCGETFFHNHGPALFMGNSSGPQNDAPHASGNTLHGGTCICDINGEARPPRPQQGEALVVQAASYQAVLHGFTGGYRSHVLSHGKWTIWHSSPWKKAFPPARDW